MSINIRQSSSVILFLAALTALATSLSGCGKQNFLVTTNLESQQAPGYFTISPKVDLLIATDDTGSALSVNSLYASLKTEMPNFLRTLDSKNWDYHLATMPLTSDTTISRVTASRHDGNYGASLWIPPYPGAIMNGPGTLISSFFSPLSQYLDTEIVAPPTLNQAGQEPGFTNILNALQNKLPQTGFLRDDALLVVLALSNGEDTSDVAYCNRGDGRTAPRDRLQAGAMLPCSINGENQTSIPAIGTSDASMNHYATAFKNMKPFDSQVKFFSAVDMSSNLGYWTPLRYKDMAARLNGEAYSISNIGHVLDSLSQSLTVQKLAMRTRYLFANQEPDVTTLQITKYVNGDLSQAVTIPQDPANGWTYEGYLSNVYAIDSPIGMNLSSGFAIELHGSAKLIGNDTASVNFKPAGTKDTVTK